MNNSQLKTTEERKKKVSVEKIHLLKGINENLSLSLSATSNIKQSRVDAVFLAIVSLHFIPYYRMTDSFSKFDYILIAAGVVLGGIIMWQGSVLIKNLQKEKKRSELENAYLLTSDYLNNKKMDINKLDNMYNSEYKNIVSLMASMNCVEARKIRYKNYLIRKIDREIAEELRDSDTFPA
mgnify:CR=1 FL=1